MSLLACVSSDLPCPVRPLGHDYRIWTDYHLDPDNLIDDNDLLDGGELWDPVPCPDEFDAGPCPDEFDAEPSADEVEVGQGSLQRWSRSDCLNYESSDDTADTGLRRWGGYADIPDACESPDSSLSDVSCSTDEDDADSCCSAEAVEEAVEADDLCPTNSVDYQLDDNSESVTPPRSLMQRFFRLFCCCFKEC